MRISSFAGLLLTPMLIMAPEVQRSTGREISCWTTNSLIKVRPSDPRPATASSNMRLYAARNEFEPFQVVLRAGREGADGVDASASNPVSANGAVIRGDSVAIYLERYLDLRVASSVEGSAGEWPDPLVPRVDRYYGERRNAFPFRLRPERNQPLWIETYIPPGTPAGTYRGSIKITAVDVPEITVPLSVTVWDFDLPSTSSLRTAYGFSGPAALKQHRGGYTSDRELHQFTNLYSKAALLHRISLYGASMVPPPFRRTKGGLVVDWTNYDSEVGPLLDGQVLVGSDPLPGARATSVDLRTHNGLVSEEDKILYWKEWIHHFRERGWLERLYYYLWDEPGKAEYPKVLEKGRLARRVGPGLRSLLTAPVDPQLEEVVDIWTPLVNCFDIKPGFPDYCEPELKRERLEAERLRGKSIWWYQSCGSHGCGGKGGDYFRGLPSYVIDVPGISNRIMPLLAWKYRIGGELYYNTNEAFSRSENPWKDVYLYGGNGDGTLFYPGKPGLIGGSKDIPIESIRLKLIREGLEDYEYLFLLWRNSSASSIDARISSVATKTYSWNPDPAILLSIRQAIGDSLSGGFHSRSMPNPFLDTSAERHDSKP